MRILMIAAGPFLEPRGTPFSVYYRAKALVTLGYEVDLVTYPFGKQVKLPGLESLSRTPAAIYPLGQNWAIPGEVASRCALVSDGLPFLRSIDWPTASLGEGSSAL